MKRIIQLIGLLFGGVLGAQIHNWMSMGAIWTDATYGMMQQSGGYYLNLGIGALCGLAAATVLAGPFLRWMQQGADRAAAMPTGELMSGVGGLIVGLALSALLFPAVSGFSGAGIFIPIVMTLFFGYVGLRIGLSKREELAERFSTFFERRVKSAVIDEESSYEEHKILDTSVIIDGRIADICKTGFIEGTLVIPEFVLEELQHIADSSDLLKRNRGRRGLDILNKIQKELDVKGTHL